MGLPLDSRSQESDRCNSTAAVGAGRGGGAGSTSFLQFHPVMHVGAAGIMFVIASPAPGAKRTCVLPCMANRHPVCRPGKW